MLLSLQYPLTARAELFPAHAANLLRLRCAQCGHKNPVAGTTEGGQDVRFAKITYRIT